MTSAYRPALKPLARLRRGARRLAGTRPRHLPLTLALQGGGAHGAFTWGVLDRLLEERRIRLSGLSGASAGAMNAVVAASGWMRDRHEGARHALHDFWRQVSEATHLGPFQPGAGSHLMPGWDPDWTPGSMMLRTLTQMASPYQFNPAGFNPLEDILHRSVDFDALREPDAPRVLVSAANLHSGRQRLFDNGSLSARVLEASACLPLLFQALEIDGEYYWDGGYAANPPLFPLARTPGQGDVLIVQLGPVWNGTVPTRPSEIDSRISELTFNAGLMRELELLAQLPPRPGLLRRLAGLPTARLHRVDANGAFDDKGKSSPYNTEWRYLTHLRDLGRQRADDWLARHGDDLGRRSTLHLGDFHPLTDSKGPPGLRTED